MKHLNYALILSQFLTSLVRAQVPAPAAASPRITGDVTSASVQSFMSANPNINSKDQVIRALPDEFKENYILMIQTESAQDASCNAPRVLMQGRNSDPIFGVSTERTGNNYTEQGLEMIRFNRERGTWDFNSIHPNLTGNQRFNQNDESCKRCHGNNPRPNWDAYDSWPNSLPFNRDRIYQGSEEEKLYKRLWERMAEDPIMSQLRLPEGVTRRVVGRDSAGRNIYRVDIDYAGKGQNDPQTTTEVTLPSGRRETINRGGRYLLMGHPNKGGASGGEGQGIAMFDQLTAMNAQRVRQEVKNATHFNTFKFALAAILNGCVSNPGDLNSFLPESAQSTRERMLGEAGPAAVASTRTAQQSLADAKLRKMRQHLRHVVECNAEAEGSTLTEQQIESKVAQELLRRNPAGFATGAGGNIVDREDYNQRIHYLRLLLEGEEGISMDRWSMSSMTRARTFTFADLSSVYLSQLQEEVQDLGRDCDTLRTQSLAAYNEAERIRTRGTGETHRRTEESPETLEPAH